MALPGPRRQTWDECFSTAWIWFLWQAVVQAALELLGFGKHGKAADGIVCGRLLLLRVIFF